MDLETLKHQKFTEEDLERIKQTRGVKFEVFKDRLTVCISLIYEQRGENPFVADCRKCYQVNNSENAFKRTLYVNQNDTVELGYEWLKGKVGLIMLNNSTGSGLPANPTLEVREQMDESKIVVSIGDLKFNLKPNQTMLVPPPENCIIRLTSVGYNSSVQTWVIPE